MAALLDAGASRRRSAPGPARLRVCLCISIICVYVCACTGGGPWAAGRGCPRAAGDLPAWFAPARLLAPRPSFSSFLKVFTRNTREAFPKAARRAVSGLFLTLQVSLGDSSARPPFSLSFLFLVDARSS